MGVPLAVSEARQNAGSEDRFVKSGRSFDVAGDEKVGDGNPILRRPLIAFLLDLCLVHRPLPFGYGISPFARIRRAVCFSNEPTHRLWHRDTAQCIDRIFSRTSNVQQQEAPHDAEIFVKAIHAIDLIRTRYCPISMPNKRSSQGV